MRADERLYSLGEAVERVTGRRLHASTFHRWRIRGVAGVRLETAKLGGRRVTSLEAVRRFLAATTLASDGTVASALPVRHDAITRAETELDNLGV